jgi:hypothetical protein
VVVGAFYQLGCSLEVTPGSEFPNDNGSPENVADKVLVSFRNLTDDEAVDVEFYFAEGDLENLPGDLFVDENRVGSDVLIQDQGIGMANLATLRPGEVDSITLDCDRGLTLGTTGGEFLDAETHEARGAGTMIWLVQDAQFFCGAVIEFRFSSDGDGFKTTYSLDP